eukprot:gene49013-57333_t
MLYATMRMYCCKRQGTTDLEREVTLLQKANKQLESRARRARHA